MEETQNYVIFMKSFERCFYVFFRAVLLIVQMIIRGNVDGFIHGFVIKEK